MVGADRAAVDRVERLRREVEALAAKLADQAERQERLRAPGRQAPPGARVRIASVGRGDHIGAVRPTG